MKAEIDFWKDKNISQNQLIIKLSAEIEAYKSEKLA